MFKRIIYLFLFFITALSCYAGDAKLTATVSKNRVAVGEQFQLEFSLNTNGSNFKAPSLADFNVYSGPNQSSSMQWVNGVTSNSISYSYIVSAKKEGTFTIGAASVNADGKSVQSAPIKIEVKGSAPQSQQPQQNQRAQGNRNSAPTASAEDIGNNLFLKTQIDKTKLYVGEQVVATFKIYTRVNIVGTQVEEMPKFIGFWNEDIKSDNAKQYNESIDGIQYTVAEVKKTILFPQRSGSLNIEPLNLVCVVRQRVKGGNSIFDQFFGGGVQDVRYNIKSKAIKIEVLPLPEPKPQSFKGVTGSYSITAKVDKQKVKANDAVNLKINISGKGNIKLIDPFKLNIPQDIETYDPKTNDKISVGDAGVSGGRTFEYLLIPRHSGNFVIPPVEFTYFDSETKKYKTLTTQSFNLEVEKGEGGENQSNQVFNGSANKEDVKVIGSDIRFIKTNSELKKSDNFFFNSKLYYILFFLPIFLFGGFIIVRKRYVAANSDVVLVKSRKANKMAKKRLEQANVHLSKNEKDLFYSEVLKAINGYLGDKFNIPVSELSREIIKQKLNEHKISEDLTATLVKVLDACEFARFAPVSSSDMGNLYTEVLNVITKIEG